MSTEKELDGFDFRRTRQRLKENSIRGEFNKGVTIGFLLPVSPYLSIELRSAPTTLPDVERAALALFVQPMQIYYRDKNERD